MLNNTHWCFKAGVHTISSAQALSFREVLEETKQAFYSLFEVGHSPSSARHVHKQALYIQAESETDTQLSLADRAHNPMVYADFFSSGKKPAMAKMMEKSYSKSFKNMWISTIEITWKHKEKPFYNGMKLQA